MQLLNLYNTNTSYRGVKYDTSNRPNQQKVEHHTVVETYRGIKHTEKVEVVS